MQAFPEDFRQWHGRVIDQFICAALSDCNQGKWMESWKDWRAVGQRIGIRDIRFSRHVPEPMLRFDATGTGEGVLWLPYPRSKRQLYFWLLHEFGEMVMKREAWPLFCYPPHWGDHHRMAVLVERFHARPANL